MTASDAESWARLRLVGGESSAKKWELVSSLGHTTLTVGSNSDCTWVVRGEGVRPIHFSLHWDGSRLRVADVYNAGDVTVDRVPLTSQWKPLWGRVRIDFGSAAMLVEASASPTSSPPRSAETLLDGAVISTPAPAVSVSSVASTQAIFGGAGAGSSSPPPPSRAPEPTRSSGGGPRNIGKGTLIGVAPQTLIEAKMLENYQPPSVTSELPDGVSAKDARRAERSRLEREKAERERIERPSMKATLVGGMGFGMKPAPSSRPPSPSEAAGPAGGQPEAPRGATAEPKSSRSGPAANATLMGFNAAEALRGIVGTPSVSVGGSDPVPSASLGEPDQRTTLGFPIEGKPSSSPPPNITIGGPVGRRMTQRGVVSQPPGVEPSAVVQPPVQRVSASPAADRTERIGSAWQELSDDAARANDAARVQSVSDPASRAGRTLRGVQDVEDGEFRPPRAGEASQWGREERFSDIPTQMRDPGSFESRRPARGFPWRYVGVVVLTGVAYFAWLYLLDRM